ncbi:MAG: hypothetical protein U1E56_09075 [Bauldia sp.]
MIKLILLTSGVLYAASPALAQAQQTPSVNPYSAQTLDRADPLGNLGQKDVDPKDAGKFAAWAKSLSEQQKLDTGYRCSVVNANASMFMPDAVSFCQGWITAQAGENQPTR